MYIFANFEGMKINPFTILLLLLTYALNAQTYEVGLLAGGSNYIGDVGRDNYIYPNELALGVAAKYNISSRYSYRASVLWANLSGDDTESGNSSRQERGYRFDNRVLEATLGMEFNFLEFNLHDFSRPVTPYIFGGVSYVSYKNMFFISSVAEDSGNKSTFAIPFGLGVKAKVGDRLVVAGEVTARYAFTDNLDGNNPDQDALDLGAVKFGNTFSHDWYVFSGVVITYTFGKKPCYYCFD